MPNKSKLIVALDVDSLEMVRFLVDGLGGLVDIYKIGSQLFTACGPAAVRFVMARGKQVFLDLKYHDIPNTVASAVRAAVMLSDAVQRSAVPGETPREGIGRLAMYTIHTCGGEEMMTAAVKAAQEAAKEIGAVPPLTVGVTVLTSQGDKLTTQGQSGILSLVLDRARMAKRCGLDGVVSSCHEAAMIRKEFGKDFVIVTPGIRPSGAEVGDQKRVAAPRGAVDAGSNYLVVGRPIVQADNPRTIAQAILDEMKN